MNRATICLACLAGLAAAAGATGGLPASAPTATAPAATAPAASRTLSIEIVNPDRPAIRISGREKPVTRAELIEILKTYRASLPEGTKTDIAIKSVPDVAYVETARVLLDCAQAGVEDYTVNDQPVHLDAASALKLNRMLTPQVRLRVTLIEASANGEYDPKGYNAFCTILFENQPLGGDFNELRRRLQAKVSAGLDPKTPVIILPTVGCEYQYAMKACAAAQGAGFSHIEFALPAEIALTPSEPTETDPAKTGKPGSGRGKFKPGPSSIARQLTENPPADIRPNNAKDLDVIGVGGGGRPIGGPDTPGDNRGFFGVGGGKEAPRKVVYIVDRSGSMTDSIDFVKYELKRSLGALTEEQEFHIIFYSSGPPVEMPTRRPIPATERNKQLAFEFIDGVPVRGETDPAKAVERAFACQPEVIYLLTDGEFDRGIIALVAKLNADKKVKVHTIGFLYQNGEDVLKEIAKQSGGEYKLVTEKDLANLAK